MIKTLARILAFAIALAIPASAQDALSPPPVLHFDDANGAPLTGGRLFTYAAGTTTKQNTYTNYGGATPNTNPVVLNTRGEANVWLVPGQAYKFVLAPAGSSDPPSAPIFTVDNIIVNASGYTGIVVTGSSNIPSYIETVCVNGTAASTQTLPASPQIWERHTVCDAGNNASTFAITVNANGNLFDNGLQSYALNFNTQSINMQWNGSVWTLQ